MKTEEDKYLNCPICGSDALYKYGRTKTGKQRYQCLICNKQFSFGAKKIVVKGKPICPKCGRHMNLYKLEKNFLRFRCSEYPECKFFKKFIFYEEEKK